MKTIPMDIATMTLVAASLPSAAAAALSYDTGAMAVSGPDDVIDQIAAVNVAALQKAALISYAASRRYAVETGGLTISGVKVATDRESQSMLNAAFNIASGNANFTTMWKGDDGTFTALTAPQIIAIAQAVGAFVASCFAAEAAAVTAINAGSITTNAQIDAAIVVPS